MGKFNEFRKKIAGKIVTYYYGKHYDKAVLEAERRHDNGEGKIYVVEHLYKGKLLSTINRKQFRAIKHAAQKLHKDETYYSYQYGTRMLSDQCWYHTADKIGKYGLTTNEIEIRRAAFIRSGLKKARLLK